VKGSKYRELERKQGWRKKTCWREKNRRKEWGKGSKYGEPERKQGPEGKNEEKPRENSNRRP
jgi:hypothetical protein